MKTILLFTLLLLQGQGCQNEPQKSNEINYLEYSAMTRGSTIYCKIDKNQIQVQAKGPNSFKKDTTIESEEWRKLSRSIMNLDLEKLHTYGATGQSSASDRSRIASLVISVGNDVYESNSFDEGYPPKELKQLTDQIVSLMNGVE